MKTPEKDHSGQALQSLSGDNSLANKHILKHKIWISSLLVTKPWPSEILFGEGED